MKFRPSIVVALVLGLSMVGGAFVMSLNKTEPLPNTNYSTRDKQIREFIVVADNDQNQLPDWQDQLALPEINLSDTENATITKTASLAIDLASQSIFNESNDFNINKTRTEINDDTPYTRNDIVIGIDDSITAQKTYGNAVAAIALKFAPPKGTEDELTILNSALVNNDPELLEKLSPTIQSYEQMLEAMEETIVPPSLVKEHLSLLNVYQAILLDVKAFKVVFNDALPAMTRFGRYQADAFALYTAISNLYLKLNDNGIQWNEADVASDFIKIESVE